MLIICTIAGILVLLVYISSHEIFKFLSYKIGAFLMLILGIGITTGYLFLGLAIVLRVIQLIGGTNHGN